MLEITARERFEPLWVLMLDHSLALQFKRIGPWAASGEDSSLVLIRFTKQSAGGSWMTLALFFKGPGSNPLGRAFRVPRDLNSNRSLKIWPDLRVFLFANAAHSFQIISASERSRGDNARRHHVPDSRHGC